MEQQFEYIRLRFDWGSLEELNSLGSAGWRVVAVEKDPGSAWDNWALLERRLPAVE